MSSELERRIQERLPGLPMNYSTRRQLRQVFTETGVAIIKNDAAASVTRNAMKNATDLVDEARRMSAGDPVKEMIAIRLVQDYVERTQAANRNILGW
ncbi:hypothetical protein KIF24_05475 [Micromonospora sp. Llam7]|uniref:hypothetical protein n=1 Tax=Micromonospora tarapacensis TaxID=2835305 RepID=UPI001C82EF02|nr:hypothetical protein [Micromonospora tarapacensis]MBX7265548.1 hypothetical protein [Micromonospora tarapacensis]